MDTTCSYFYGFDDDLFDFGDTGESGEYDCDVDDGSLDSPCSTGSDIENHIVYDPLQQNSGFINGSSNPLHPTFHHDSNVLHQSFQFGSNGGKIILPLYCTMVGWIKETQTRLYSH